MVHSCVTAVGRVAMEKRTLKGIREHKQRIWGHPLATALFLLVLMVLFLPHRSGKTSFCKWLQFRPSHQPRRCKLGGRVLSLQTNPLQLAKHKSFQWELGCCLNLGPAHWKQESSRPKAYLFRSAASGGLIHRDISPYSSHHENRSHLSRRTFPWTTLTFSVDAAFSLWFLCIWGTVTQSNFSCIMSLHALYNNGTPKAVAESC